MDAKRCREAEMYCSANLLHFTYWSKPCIILNKHHKHADVQNTNDLHMIRNIQTQSAVLCDEVCSWMCGSVLWQELGRTSVSWMTWHNANLNCTYQALSAAAITSTAHLNRSVAAWPCFRVLVSCCSREILVCHILYVHYRTCCCYIREVTIISTTTEKEKE